jgi:formylglycine-generating enzyme required for sulfatase activity
VVTATLFEVTIPPPTPPDTDQLEWVTVNGGTFQMGSDNGEFDEQPVHTVTVNTFYINKYEITNSQYCEFLNARGVAPDGSYGGIDYIDIDITGCQITYSGNQFIPENGKDSHPVNYVTWDGAGAYCVWAGVRLPTEAEWEFAARGGNQSLGYIYSGSDNVDDVGWYVTNAVNESHPVGQKLPNELGLYDMSGNVWEWCSDWYSSGYYGISPTSNPQGPDSGTNHAVRGGSYLISGDNLRSANRQDAGNWGWISVGFRCVKNQ